MNVIDEDRREIETPLFQDERTPEEKKTHFFLIGGVDSFMSSFGPPEWAGVKSRAYWACTPEQLESVLAWVKSRDEFKRVYIEIDKRDAKSLHSHLSLGGTLDYVHIYTVQPGHPSLEVGADV